MSAGSERMKRRMAILLCLAGLLGLVPGGGRAAEVGMARIMAATDLHYLSPSLYQGSDVFLAALRRGDGKLTQHSDVLLQALLDEARHQQPDALILTGDLTFNGEKQSHLELAAALRAFAEETGIPVRVIPGNHDILIADAHAFFQGGWAGTATITEAEFGEIYADLVGATPDAGYSTVLKANERAWVALLDVGVYTEDASIPFGVCREAHNRFLQQTLAEAEEAGALVVTCTHQNLLDQTSFNPESFGVWYPGVLHQLLRESPASARLNLSGHIHAQHIVTQDGLTDAATGALSVSPHLYAMVTVDPDGEVTYSAQPLCDAHLPEGFQAMSHQWFRSITIDKDRPQTAAFGVSAEEEEKLLAFAGDFNAAFFAGTLREEREALMASPGYAAWKRLTEVAAFARYMDQLMDEAEQDCRYWENGPYLSPAQ